MVGGHGMAINRYIVNHHGQIKMKYELWRDGKHVCRVDDDGHKTAHFRNQGELGKIKWADYQVWLAAGNTPDPYPVETDEEKTTRLAESLRFERDDLLKNSDIMMLEDYPNGGGQAIKDYRQALRDMPSTHTTIAQLESPTWPVM